MVLLPYNIKIYVAGRKCQIVEVKYLKRQKRSAGDFDLNFEFIINGERKILHLKASNGILVNPKTPVYYVTSNRNGHTIERKDNVCINNFFL